MYNVYMLLNQHKICQCGDQLCVSSVYVYVCVHVHM